MYALVRMPGFDRYWISETRDYTAAQNNKFAARDLKHWVLLQQNNGIISFKNSKTGVGYLNNIFLRILIAAAFAAIGTLIIDKKIRHRK